MLGFITLDSYSMICGFSKIDFQRGGCRNHKDWRQNTEGRTSNAKRSSGGRGGTGSWKWNFEIQVSSSNGGAEQVRTRQVCMQTTQRWGPKEWRKDKQCAWNLWRRKDQQPKVKFRNSSFKQQWKCRTSTKVSQLHVRIMIRRDVLLLKCTAPTSDRQGSGAAAAAAAASWSVPSSPWSVCVEEWECVRELCIDLDSASLLSRLWAQPEEEENLEQVQMSGRVSTAVYGGTVAAGTSPLKATVHSAREGFSIADTWYHFEWWGTGNACCPVLFSSGLDLDMQNTSSRMVSAFGKK